jgi:ATP-dependent helicase YprA (DUF1998 family)
MNIFDFRDRLVSSYEDYIRSFVRISDPQIAEVVERELSTGHLWPEPLLQLNPAFEEAGSIDQLSADGTLHPDCSAIFSGYRLWEHQRAAIHLGSKGRDFSSGWYCTPMNQG